MAKKANNVKQKKLTKIEREHIDNRIVLATAIGLISAILLLYIYQWLNARPTGTGTFISVLIWIFDAGILACVALYFIKKNRKLLYFIPYLVAAAFLLSVIRYYTIYQQVLNTLYISFLWGKLLGLLSIASPRPRTCAFIFAYVCIAAYLITTYIYYGRKLKKIK